jgi:hypothetical protein
VNYELLSLPPYRRNVITLYSSMGKQKQKISGQLCHLADFIPGKNIQYIPETGNCGGL